MDDTMVQFQQKLVAVEVEAEELLLARHQVVENDKMRNGNREALTALRRKARTTATSIPTPFGELLKEIGEVYPKKSLVSEICRTCGNHDALDKTWMMFPGIDAFARVPFHAAHNMLEEDQLKLEVEARKLQSYVKEKSFTLSESGALADKISPGVMRSLVGLTDKQK